MFISQSSVTSQSSSFTLMMEVRTFESMTTACMFIIPQSSIMSYASVQLGNGFTLMMEVRTFESRTTAGLERRSASEPDG